MGGVDTVTATCMSDINPAIKEPTQPFNTPGYTNVWFDDAAQGNSLLAGCPSSKLTPRIVPEWKLQGNISFRTISCLMPCI